MRSFEPWWREAGGEQEPEMPLTKAGGQGGKNKTPKAQTFAPGRDASPPDMQPGCMYMSPAVTEFTSAIVPKNSHTGCQTLTECQSFRKESTSLLVFGAKHLILALAHGAKSLALWGSGAAAIILPQVSCGSAASFFAVRVSTCALGGQPKTGPRPLSDPRRKKKLQLSVASPGEKTRPLNPKRKTVPNSQRLGPSKALVRNRGGASCESDPASGPSGCVTRGLSPKASMGARACRGRRPGGSRRAVRIDVTGNSELGRAALMPLAT